MTAALAELDRRALTELLLSCMKVPRWAQEVAAAGPYAEVGALLAQARASGTPLRPGELDAALADHPRIGERHTGQGRSARFSRAEQAASRSDDPELERRLAEGNRAYEERFGRVFLIRAAGRSRAEILAELDRRLALDEDEERRTAEQQLLEIALLRIAALFPEQPARSAAEATPTAPDDDARKDRR